MKKVFPLIALFTSLYAIDALAVEGKGYTIVSESRSVTGTTSSGVIDLPVKKKLTTPETVSVSVSTRDVNAKARQFAEIDSWHGVYLQNISGSTLRYFYELHLECGEAISNYTYVVDIQPGGYFSKESLVYEVAQATAPGRYPIKATTRVWGAEFNYLEAHAMFNATQ